ncbi:MYG1 exonuclease [Centruroides vittatus]|uniref:MYG1 exonuclease n=1 Tax=Centruroides vittatus TaxID=120091 RepID=UPI00350EA26C
MICFSRNVKLFSPRLYNVCLSFQHRSKMAEPNKKLCMEKIKIGTHNGTFHCDEVLACFLLKLLPKYKDATIIRTRDENILKDCHIVVDVGGCYNPDKHRYDHHQRSFNESMKSLSGDKPWVTKLSSAGLVYFHFGREIIATITKDDCNSEKTSVIFDRMYEHFLEEIDAIDNGISTHDEPGRYLITTNLSSRVKNLNPPWNCEDQDTDKIFPSAMELVGSEFVDKVLFYNNVWWPAREIVQSAIKNREEVDSSREIIDLKNGGCPWKDHLLTLEEQLSITPSIKFVIYTDTNGMWRVQCVPVSIGSFENRVSLKEEWQGLRDKELSQVSGIPNCIFVHANGFIGGNKTRDGVIEMARKSLQITN